MLTNSQHDAVMRRYSLIQADEQRALARRREQAYDKIPSLRLLDEEVGRISLERARHLIESGSLGEERDDYNEALSSIALQRKQLLADNGFPEDHLTLHYRCPLCQDTGYVDGKRCKCFDRMAADLLFEDPSLRGDLELHNFDRFSFDLYSPDPEPEYGLVSPRENMVRIVSEARSFIDGFDETPGFLLFYGRTGLGKTFLSHCIAKELLEAGHSVIYQCAPDMFNTMAGAAFSRNEPASEDQELFLTCDLLIIDDLGTELVNSFVAGSLFYLLNERIRHKKSTIISTNLSLEEIENTYSERVFSRIVSSFGLMHFYGDDIRLEQRIRMAGGTNGQN